MFLASIINESFYYLFVTYPPPNNSIIDVCNIDAPLFANGIMVADTILSWIRIQARRISIYLDIC
jgi:hypothetical protein